MLTRHLAKLADACGATEVVLFERTTFLVIATSVPQQLSPPLAPAGLPSPSPSTPSTLSSFGSHASDHTDSVADADDGDPHKLEGTRYERTSELIKAFKHSCTRVREEFHTLEMELADFTAVLDELTKNTYVLIIVHDPTVGASFPFLPSFSSSREPFPDAIYGCHASLFPVPALVPFLSRRQARVLTRGRSSSLDRMGTHRNSRPEDERPAGAEEVRGAAERQPLGVIDSRHRVYVRVRCCDTARAAHTYIRALIRRSCRRRADRRRGGGRLSDKYGYVY